MNRHLVLWVAVLLVLRILLLATGASAGGGDRNHDDFEQGDDDPDCRDDRPGPDCPRASDRGECWTMRDSTAHVCRASCWLCVNATALRRDGVTEEEIRRRREYSRTDFGPLPGFPPHPNPRPEVLRAMEVVAAMDSYARQFPSSPTCHNARPECPYWAALGHCRTNYPYMMEECGLACRYCGERSRYDKCFERVQEHREEAQRAFSQRKQSRKRTGHGLPLSHVSQWKDRLLAEFPESAANVLGNASESNGDVEEDVWAIRFDSFLTTMQRDELQSTVLSFLPFEPSRATGYEVTKTLSSQAQSDYKVPHIVRRTSNSAHCPLECIRDHRALQAALKRVTEALRLPTTALIEKPIEFVSYGPTQTFAEHSDCRIHDHWLGAGGYRLATAYVGISGGIVTVGFPNREWEMVSIDPGQLIVWPNVLPRSLSDDGVTPTCNGLKTEILASPGTSHGMLIHIRHYPVDETLPARCR